MVGTTRGYGFAGLVGGLISSTAVTLTFARQSRAEPEAAMGLATGVIAACTILLLRVMAVTFVLNPATGVGAGSVSRPALRRRRAAHRVRILRRQPPTPAAAKPPHGRTRKVPLRLMSAIRLAVLFQGSLMALDLVRSRVRGSGVLPLAALLGFTDMDALTVAMAKLRPAAEMAALGAQAITVGLLSNTVLKLGLAVGLGTSEFRRSAGAGLLLLGAATLLALLFL